MLPSWAVQTRRSGGAVQGASGAGAPAFQRKVSGSPSRQGDPDDLHDLVTAAGVRWIGLAIARSGRGGHARALAWRDRPTCRCQLRPSVHL